MLKRILGAIILVPIVLMFSFWGVNFVAGVLSGEVNLGYWIMDHKFIIGLVVAFFVFKFVNPFKK